MNSKDEKARSAELSRRKFLEAGMAAGAACVVGVAGTGVCQA